MGERRTRSRRLGPVATVAAGAVAGAVGTAAMDTVWYVRYRRGQGTKGPFDWEFAGVSKWDDVSGPGEVGKLVLKAVLGHDPPEQWAQTTQNVVHWATGIGWGVQFAVVSGFRGRPSWAGGLVLGPVEWLTSYAVLPLIKVYKPIWEYDRITLAKDLSAHLVYGSVTGLVFAAKARRRSATPD